MTVQIADLKTAEIVKLYNTVAEKAVFKFADRKTAEARLQKLMAEKSLTLVAVGDGFSLEAADYSPEGGNAVDPTEDAEEPTEQPADEQSAEATAAGQPPADEITDGEPTEEQAAAAKSLADRIAEAKAKREAEEKAKKSATKTGKRGPAGTYADDATIQVLVKDNPKKAGSASAKRFAIYKSGMTVAEFLKAGGTRADLAWDAKHEFVKIG